MPKTMTFCDKSLSEMILSMPLEKINISDFSINGDAIPDYLYSFSSFTSTKMNINSIDIRYSGDNDLVVKIQYIMPCSQWRGLSFKFSITDTSQSILDLISGIENNTIKDNCTVTPMGVGLQSPHFKKNDVFTYFSDDRGIIVNNNFYSYLLHASFYNLSDKEIDFYQNLTEEQYLSLIEPKITVVHDSISKRIDFGDCSGVRSHYHRWDTSKHLRCYKYCFGMSIDISREIDVHLYDAFSEHLKSLFIKNNKWVINFDNSFVTNFLKEVSNFKKIINQNNRILF